MPDVPVYPEPEPEPTVAERVNAGYQALMPGVPLRRAALFVAIGVSLALNLPAIGIVALIALALTDQVVAL